MAHKTRRFCRHIGCINLTAESYCMDHKDDARQAAQARDRRRGSSRQRGYTYRWEKYSKWFLSQPENKFCTLHMDNGCHVLAQCVDHIDPPDGPDDERFWDECNHQAACIHCNSVKGHRRMVGTFIYGELE